VPTPAPVVVIPWTGACTAKQQAAIYVRPDYTANLEAVVWLDAQDQVELTGYIKQYWTKWLRVRCEDSGVEGFIYIPHFECRYGAEPLRLGDAAPAAFCEAGARRAAVRVEVIGGTRPYACSWEEQPVNVAYLEEGVYLASWSWGVAPQAGELTVSSEDGQSVSTDSLYIAEPGCE
jgi:hypothetical protein